MLKKYKYEIAFSVAEEDLRIAQTIAAFLKANNISYYLYSEHESRHWGENLMKLSFEKYAKESKCVLLIVSNIYATKHWSDVERQVAQSVGKVDEGSILQLRLDDVCLDGLSKNIVYIKWNNDPGDIAKRVGAKVRAIRRKRKRNTFLKIMTVIIAACMLKVLINYTADKRIERKERAKDEQADSTKINVKPPALAPVPVPTPVPAPVTPDMPSLHDNAGEQPVAADKPAEQEIVNPAGYYLSLSGDGETVDNLALKQITDTLNNTYWVYTPDSATAMVRLHLDCSMQTIAIETEETAFRTSCNCHLTLISGRVAPRNGKDLRKVEYSTDHDANVTRIAAYIVEELRGCLKSAGEHRGSSRSLY